MSGVPIQISKVKNSDNTFDALVPPGTNYTLPDITNTDVNGAPHVVPGEKNWTDPATPAGGTVENSDDSYSAPVPSGGLLILPDITFKDTNGSTSSKPAVKNINATQIPSIAAQDLDNQLTVTQRNTLSEIFPTQTGQTTSYNSGDDGALKNGRLTDFFTLKENNSFGNKNRFTDEFGLQVFASNYVIDHATGYGWCSTLQTGESWTATLAAASSFSLVTGVGTLNNFFVPNCNEALAIARYDTVCLNYAPFNLNPGTANQIWTSTTNYSLTTAALRMSFQTFPALSSQAKTASVPALFCRIHNIPT